MKQPQRFPKALARSEKMADPILFEVDKERESKHPLLSVWRIAQASVKVGVVYDSTRIYEGKRKNGLGMAPWIASKNTAMMVASETTRAKTPQ